MEKRCHVAAFRNKEGKSCLISVAEVERHILQLVPLRVEDQLSAVAGAEVAEVGRHILQLGPLRVEDELSAVAGTDVVVGPRMFDRNVHVEAHA